MIVIADTTPLNYLLQINAVAVLQKLYGRVLLPGAVVRELQAGGAPAVVRLWAADLPGWVKVEDLEPSSILNLANLDMGETEAISLGLLRQADVLLIDDALARKIAEAHGLHVTGTLGVLRDAADEGLLRFAESVEAIRRLGFRVSDSVVAEMIADHG